MGKRHWRINSVEHGRSHDSVLLLLADPETVSGACYPHSVDTRAACNRVTKRCFVGEFYQRNFVFFNGFQNCDNRKH